MTRRAHAWAGALCAVGIVWSGRVDAQEPLRPAGEAMLAPPAPAEPVAESPSGKDTWRAMLYLALGGGGDTELEVDPTSPLLGSGFSVDNNVTAGFGLRLEHPFGGFFVLGAQAELLSYETDGADRDIGGHFDLWIKLRQLHRYNARVEQESYLGVPVGFSVVRFDDNPLLKRDSSSLGWNVGALLGIQFIVDGRYGTFMELGWRRFEVYNEEVSSGSNLSSASNQFAFDAGYALHF